MSAVGLHLMTQKLRSGSVTVFPGEPGAKVSRKVESERKNNLIEL